MRIVRGNDNNVTRMEQTIPINAVSPSGKEIRFDLNAHFIKTSTHSPSPDGFVNGFDKEIHTNHPWLKGYQLFTNEEGLAVHLNQIARHNRGIPNIITTRPMR